MSSFQDSVFYDHEDISLLNDYVAVKSILFVFGVMGSGYVEDTTFLGWNSICFFPCGQFVYLTFFYHLAPFICKMMLLKQDKHANLSNEKGD